MQQGDDVIGLCEQPTWPLALSAAQGDSSQGPRPLGVGVNCQAQGTTVPDKLHLSAITTGEVLAAVASLERVRGAAGDGYECVNFFLVLASSLFR